MSSLQNEVAKSGSNIFTTKLKQVWIKHVVNIPTTKLDQSSTKTEVHVAGSTMFTISLVPRSFFLPSLGTKLVHCYSSWLHLTQSSRGRRRAETEARRHQMKMTALLYSYNNRTGSNIIIYDNKAKVVWIKHQHI